MVVLRGLGLSRISVPIPIGRSSREKVQTQHKKFARHLSPCTPLAPHHTDLKPVFRHCIRGLAVLVREKSAPAADLPDASRTVTLPGCQKTAQIFLDCV
jgi:hypothetical protein